MPMQLTPQMQQMARQLMTNFKQGMLNNHPLAAQYRQMMQGKNPEQVWQTLVNSAQSRGMDVNQKMFSEEFVRGLGLIK